jgi:hypothetical protein
MQSAREAGTSKRQRPPVAIGSQNCTLPGGVLPKTLFPLGDGMSASCANALKEELNGVRPDWFFRDSAKVKF